MVVVLGNMRMLLLAIMLSVFVIFCLSSHIVNTIFIINAWTRILTVSILQKHAYSNILKILQPKKEKFQIKNSDIFHIPALNIDCGYSLELPRLTSTHNLCFFFF